MILGADKRNPLLSVYHDEDQAQFLIYYGFEIIELVPDVPQSPAYKLMFGRLYNFGVKCRSLCETFSVDPKTLRRFGRALKSAPDEMVRLLEGRGAARKITLEMQAFARMRWPDLVAYRSYGAAGRLRQEPPDRLRSEALSLGSSAPASGTPATGPNSTKSLRARE